MARRSLSDGRYGDVRRQRVLAALRRGRDAARSHSAIAEELGVNRRSVEIAVNALRRDGWPIAGGGAGQWITDDPAELWATFDWLRSKVRSQVITGWAVRRTARQMRAGQVEQTTLFGDGGANAA